MELHHITLITVTLFLTLATSIKLPLAGTGNETTCWPEVCNRLMLRKASELRKQFLDFKNLKEAFVIKIHLHYNKGVVKKQASNATGQMEQFPRQIDSFDPNTWMWVSQFGIYAVDLPLDYKFVSLGLLALKEYDLDVGIVDDEECMKELVVPWCWNRLMFKTLSKLVWPVEKAGLGRYGEHISRDYLCRSAYTYSSFLSVGKDKSVGWKCCSYEEQTLGKCHTGKILKKPNPNHQKALLAFSILLAIGLYVLSHGLARAKLVSYAWKGQSWDWIGNYFGYGPITYRTYILNIGPGDSKRWVHVSDEELLQGENCVSLPELWQLFGGPLHSGRCIVVFKFVFILIIFISVSVIAIPKVYSDQSATLNMLRDGEEVVTNLRSVPLAWWMTNPTFWPRNFGILLLVGFFFALIIELILVLIFVIGFPRRLPKDFQRYIAGTSGNPRNTSNRQKRSSQALILSVLFVIVDVLMGCTIIAGIVYPMVQVIVHVALAVIIYIDTLTPWVIAVAMTLLHVHLNYKQFRQPYVDIKEILHAEFLESSEAIQAYTVWDIQQNKSIRAFKSETEEEGSEKSEKPASPIPKLPPRMLRTLLLTFQQDGRPTILMEHFIKVSRHLVSNRCAVCGFVVRLVLFLTYLSVIMSSITLYRSSSGGGDRSTEGLVTGAVVFVFLLLPHAYVAGRRRYKSSTCRLLWKLEIQHFIQSLETEWDGQFDSPEAKLRATFNRKRRREKWSVILEDDDVNPDPPLEFPQAVVDHGTKISTLPTARTYDPDARVWAPRPLTTTGDVGWANSTSTIIVGGADAGSASTLNDEPPQPLRMASSESNMSIMSSTTT